ncbi:type III-A CRISPR-associated RAMP protein Csm4 [Thermophagus sp. OGC60D27]|uniref:type III-A CRISPR-associated RAMP protein Csm4 n=1 Tax=Thermophagus sp. OGC60D27 TaxID=3458415 RepID=UPI0040384359
MHLIKLRLKPGCQFHLGNYTPFLSSVLHETATYIHSDILFSALINTAHKIGKADDLVDHFEKEDVKISSCFYMLETPRASIYFLPKPLIPLTDQRNCNDEQNYKRLKKIQFVSTGVFHSGISMNEWFSDIHKETFFHNNNWIATRNELTSLLGEKNDVLYKNISFFTKQNIPQVKVHTTTQIDSFYQNTNLQIANLSEQIPHLKVHFYFLAIGTNDLLRQTVSLLKDEGLGGQRSTGCGEIEETEWIDNPDGFEFGDKSSTISLSLIAPGQNEINYLDNAFYQTIIRGGRFIGKNVRLKKLVMLKEGSVIDLRLKGAIKNISPYEDKPYLRYGKTFHLPIPKSILP